MFGNPLCHAHNHSENDNISSYLYALDCFLTCQANPLYPYHRSPSRYWYEQCSRVCNCYILTLGVWITSVQISVPCHLDLIYHHIFASFSYLILAYVQVP